jgi:DNA repair photolyase
MAATIGVMPHQPRLEHLAQFMRHYPDRGRHVLALIRDTRAGQLNDSRFHERFRGTGPYADLLAKRFARAARQWGFEDRVPLETRHFAAPAGTGSAPAPQLSLF